MANSAFIVESNDLFREGMRLILAAASFDVVGTGSSLDDIKQLADKQSIALFVLGEPAELTVSQMIDEILCDHRHARIVVLGDRHDAEMSATCLERGAKGYLHKSLSPASFVRALQLVSDSFSVVAGWPDGCNRASLRRALQPPACSTDEAEPSIRQTHMLSPPTGNGIAVSPGPFEPVDHQSHEAVDRPPLTRNLSGLRMHNLSPREASILKLLMGGKSNKQIARELDIMEGTVKVHIKTILRKIDVRNRTQAAIWAMADPKFTSLPH